LTHITPTNDRDHLQVQHSLQIQEERHHLETYIEDRLDYLQNLQRPNTHAHLSEAIKDTLPSAITKTKRLLEWLREPEYNHLHQYPQKTPASSTTSEEYNWPSARELLAIAHDEQLTIFHENPELGPNHYKMEIETAQPNYESYFTIPIITTALQRCNLYTLKNGHFYPLPSNIYARHLNNTLTQLADSIYTTFCNSIETPQETIDRAQQQTEQQDNVSDTRKQRKLESTTKPKLQTGIDQFLHDILPGDPATALLRIETSKLPNAGKGAFAKATIQHKPNGKPTTIAIYQAYTDNPPPPVTYEQLTSPDYQTDYGYTDKENGIALDPYNHQTKTPLCLAAYINDPLDPLKWNVAFRRKNKEVTIITTKTIGKGQELYTQYGPTYWNDPKHPTTLIRKAMIAYNVFTLDDAWSDTLKQAEQRDQRNSPHTPVRKPMEAAKTIYNALTGKTHIVKQRNKKPQDRTTATPKKHKKETIIQLLNNKRTRDSEQPENTPPRAHTTMKKPKTQESDPQSHEERQLPHTNHDTSQKGRETEQAAKTPANANSTQATEPHYPQAVTTERRKRKTTETDQPQENEATATLTKKARRRRNQPNGTSISNFFTTNTQQVTTEPTAANANPTPPGPPPPERDGIG
jgi:hypothetical protein